MKKILSFVLALAVTAAGGVQAFAQGNFSDISAPKYEWAKDYIVDMAEQGYINGYEDGTYRPDNEVTRLETILLFARAMGSNKSANKEIVKLAKEKYADVVEASGISFGQDEVSYMLFRGILTEEDIEKYLSNGKAVVAMPRQEAAAIITKAMCGEAAAKAEVLTDTDYTDAKEIDSAYSQYVFYVSEKGIMNGMDDGSFAPNNSVLRSQIAVMLSRTVDKMNLYIETVMVSGIDATNNNITIVDNEEAEVLVGYNDNTKFYDGAKSIKDTDFVELSNATLTYINNELVFVDMLEKNTSLTKKGVYQGSVTENGSTIVTIKPDGQSKAVDYDLSANAKLIADSGSINHIRNLAINSYVEYDVVNDIVTRVEQINKTKVISEAVIESIGIEDDLYLVISHKDKTYDGMKFVLTDKVVVYKNNDVENLSKLYKGDRVTITLEYGEVAKIVAVSNTKTYEGTISEVVISQHPVLKVKVSGNIVEYDIVPNIAITVDGQEGTLYDLRVGDNVKITTESGAVLKIATIAGAISTEPVTGVVEVVNTSKGFIKINGETIFCKDSTTTIITSGGTAKTMKNLEVGMTVSVRGSMQNGAYNASLIIIE